MRVVYDDGGRWQHFKGNAGDCVTRAIAITSAVPYIEVYNELFNRAKEYAKTHRNKYARAMAKNPTPRNGMHRVIYEPYLFELGYTWESYMGIGTGCRVHMREDELPSGYVIAVVSKHLVAVVDGVVKDTYDCTRDGTRCVYGAYRIER